MAHTDAAPRPAGAWRASWWQSGLLGVVLILAGLLVLRDATAATVVSAIVFGLGKAGYPQFLSLFAIFPAVGLIQLWWLAFARWPIERDAPVPARSSSSRR